MSLSLNQFLLLYTWFLVATLIGFLALIARYYERFSGRRMYYRYFVVPILVLGGSSIRYAGLDRISGDSLADIASGLGGIVLIVLCRQVYRLMIAHSKG